MSIGDSSHRVDLEVLVRSAGGHGFDWSPVRERWLGIVEPLVAQVLHVVVIDVGHSLGDFTARQSSTELEHIGTDLCVNGLRSFGVQQGVVKMISATNDFNVIDVVAIDGWQADTTVVHLSCENLISKEVVAEDTAIRVSEIVRVCPCDIWKITEHGMHGIVLLVYIVKMSGILIDSVLTKQVLKEQEGVVVWMFDAWCIIENTNI